MHLQIKSADVLGKALGAANSALSTKGDGNPLTGAMLLQTAPEELWVTVANTGTHQLRLVVPATIPIGGSVLLPPDYFTKMVNRFGDKPLELEKHDAQLVATVGTEDIHKFDLYQGDPGDFPLDLDLPPVAAIVNADGFFEGLKAVLAGAFENEQEIMFQGEGQTLSIMTSNYVSIRTRFQIAEPKFNFKFGVTKSLIAGGRIPAWTGNINIHVGDGKVAFSKGNEHLLIRQVKPEPDTSTVEELVSIEPIGKFVVSLGLFRTKVHTIAIGKQNCALKVTGRTHKQLQIKAETASVGGSNMPIPIQGVVTGSAKEIKLDVALLEKTLKTIDGDDVRVEFVDYIGDGDSVSLRLCNDANPEKRQALVTPLQG